MAFYVYIVASRRNGTLYVGHTDDLRRRIWSHKQREQGFTARYGVDRLVWFEGFGSRWGAFTRERQLKKWRRVWKLQLIEDRNPEWDDWYDRLNDWLPFD